MPPVNFDDPMDGQRFLSAEQFLLTTLARLGLSVLAVALSNGLENEAHRATDRVPTRGAARQ